MFIELNRTFLVLEKSPKGNGDALLPFGASLNWTDLKQLYRVIVLSEAGSGKTEEIRNATKRLIEIGKSAFFIRLEHVVADFEGAFEPEGGSFADFQSWQATEDEGWLFLDSVDESRLKSPSNFHSAIRRLGSVLGTAKQRLHVIITSRTPAWRPATDLELCERHLPLKSEEKVFTIVALSELKHEQVKIFSAVKGVTDVTSFIEEVERTDAWTFTTRPDDLAELTDFWKQHKRIGSRLELMENSVKRRLTEHDQTRAEIYPIAYSRLVEGVRMVAAASTLAHEPTICVPDGGHNSKGLDIRMILPNWDESERAILLSRPIFDKAIYGTVRFHHRSVREYLAAQWFANLLARETSRQKIEALFFNEQYGLEVVVPAMRPMLPWLAITDAKILARVRRIGPEILFEGGDPSKLPITDRQALLYEICKQLSAGTVRRSAANADAIIRFACVELAPDIKSLLLQYADNDDLLAYLLRMVLYGELKGLLPDVTALAHTKTTGKYARNVAFRVVGKLGSADDQSSLRQRYLDEGGALDRNLLSELLVSAQPSETTVHWFFNCLQKVAEKERYNVDMLSMSLPQFVAALDIAALTLYVEKVAVFLNYRPIISHSECELSIKNAWLLSSAVIAVERLVKDRNTDALLCSSLSILHKLPTLARQTGLDIGEDKTELTNLIPMWAELNFALFWYYVEHERRKLNKGEQLTDWWNAHTYRSSIKFGENSFDSVLREFTKRSIKDDKLVAVSLAFHLYQNHTRNPTRLAQLKKATRIDPDLANKLQALLHPPKLTAEQRGWRMKAAHYKRQDKRRQLAEKKNEADWRAHVTANVNALRNPGFVAPDAISQAQHYLHERMRKTKQNSSRWSDGNWQSLSIEFGEDVARAFRDGAVAYWRRNRPEVMSEGAKINSTPLSTIFGLTGLAIEAHETEGWPETLNAAEVELSFRYAMGELNGFPPWLSSLLPKFTNEILKLSLTEIEHQLANDDGDKASSYLLYDVSWSGDWLWNAIAPCLYESLATSEPKNFENLTHVLRIVQRSSLVHELIANLARGKTQVLTQNDHLSCWFAVWTGVDPEIAIAAFEAHTASIADEEARTQNVMLYLTQIIGGRRSNGSSVRDAYKTPKHLKTLYLLAHKYVKQCEDIDRAGKGVYSPQLRDDAQDARNHLFELLKNIPGKEAYLAIDEISKAHPDADSRPWFGLQAKLKAEADADSSPWTVEQVCDFYQTLERTPTTHRELFDLAVMRLLDLKADIEHGDSSVASLLMTATDEKAIQKYIGNWLRQSSRSRYSIPQEEELADATRPDFRWFGMGFDAPVPMELKLADKWPGPALFERLENQLCGDYLRDVRSSRGIYLLCNRGIDRQNWEPSKDAKAVNFDELVSALQDYWLQISWQFPKIDEIRVIGIDLTKRKSIPLNKVARSKNSLK